MGKCSAKIDLIIVMDNSGSIEARGREGFFVRIKAFIKHLYRGFQVGSNGDVALVEASNDAKVIFNFGQYRDVGSMDAALNQIEYKKERSFIGKCKPVFT